MKKLILAFLLAVSFVSPFAASAAELRDLSWSQVQEQIRARPSQNVVIEFYSSKADGLECDRCQAQEAILRAVAVSYGAEISFVRVDIANTPHLKELGVVGIYPTHLFVRHKVPQGEEMVAKRIQGFLSARDFNDLIEEFFEIKQ